MYQASLICRKSVITHCCELAGERYKLVCHLPPPPTFIFLLPLYCGSELKHVVEVSLSSGLTQPFKTGNDLARHGLRLLGCLMGAQ